MVAESDFPSEESEARLPSRGSTPEAAAPSFIEPARSLLQKVGEDFGWDVGCVWRLDPPAKVLRFVVSWHKAGAATSELERMSAKVAFSPGVGLPGRVFASGEPAWISDVQTDPSFPRASAAAVEGIRGAFGVPILAGRSFVGVIEFFSRHIRERDDKLLRTVTSMGSELGPLLAAGIDGGDPL